MGSLFTPTTKGERGKGGGIAGWNRLRVFTLHRPAGLSSNTLAGGGGKEITNRLQLNKAYPHTTEMAMTATLAAAAAAAALHVHGARTSI